MSRQIAEIALLGLEQEPVFSRIAKGIGEGSSTFRLRFESTFLEEKSRIRSAMWKAWKG